MQVFFALLVCVANCPSKDFRTMGHDAYYSKETCLKETRLLAQALYEEHKIEYAYKCVPSTYEPKELKD